MIVYVHVLCLVWSMYMELKGMGLCPTYSDRSLIQVSSALVLRRKKKIDNELDMHKHWQLSQCACAGNHISAAGQGH